VDHVATGCGMALLARFCFSFDTVGARATRGLQFALSAALVLGVLMVGYSRGIPEYSH
jgi:hypothetical protein